jgi:hypothetical protein
MDRIILSTAIKLLTKNVHLVGAQKVLQDLSLHDIQDEFLKE